MTEVLQAAVDIDLKACCAALYEIDWARLLLGDSFHPGGLALTELLGTLLELGPDCRVLDVAAGKGASAIFLARHFGCQVVGLDYSAKNIAQAAAAAEHAGVGEQVQFRQGDAEALPFGNGEFDVVICECAFCTFPDKHTAAAEFARVLRHGGRVGLSDLTRSRRLPDELSSLLGWIACFADAQSVGQYTAYLEGAGFTIESVESHDTELRELVGDIRAKLLGAELIVKLKKLDLPGLDFEQVRQLARSAAQSVREGKIGYALIVGRKQAGDA